MNIEWLTAFIDQPTSVADVSTRFWLEVTDSQLSARRGSNGEFATLIPSNGDPYLRVQRTDGTEPEIHLDLHVDDATGAHAKAERLGARTVDTSVVIVMTSPGGVRFCLVSPHGEADTPSAPFPTGGLVDQVCIDIPGPLMETEAHFWAELTGWERRHGSRDEFDYLVRPARIPIRLLLQRLGDDAGDASAHLDLACGDHVEEATRVHEALGATTIDVRERWTVMQDPAGMTYCLTSRDPSTGTGRP